MKKSNKIFGIVSLLIISVFLFGFYLSNHLNPSYAINTGINRSGVPTSTFTSNRTSSSTVNYIQNALTSKGQTSSFISNFEVPSNFKASDNSTPLYLLMKNLEVPTTSERFELVENNPTSVTNNGILYILAQGYNTTNTNNNIFSTNRYGSVTDNSIKQYVTQIALWLYIYENKSNFSSSYCADGGCDFLDTNGNSVTASSIRELITSCGSISGYNYLNYILLLIDNAKNYKGSETSKIASFSGTSFSYQIDNDFTLLITDTITPSVSSNNANFMYYSVEVKDPNNYGVYITDIENNKISSTNVISGSFKVAVPLSEDISTMDLSSIEIQIYGHFVKDDGYAYRVTSTTDSLLNKNKTQKYSDVLYGYTPYEVVGTSFKLYNFVKISKMDVTNSSELPGATLVITNKNDEEKTWTWVSTYKPHYIYLENGDYTLCETIAPEGFALNTECIDFTIDGTEIISVVMENEPIVDVPNTGFFQSMTLYYLGGFLLLVGVIGIYIVLKKKNSNENS